MNTFYVEHKAARYKGNGNATEEVQKCSEGGCAKGWRDKGRCQGIG